MTGGRTAPRLAMVVAAGLVCLIVSASAARSQKSDDVVALDAEVIRLYRANLYAEATEIAKRSLAVREKALGPDHPDIATALISVALLYRVQGRVAEAVPFSERILAIREKARGANHPDVATLLPGREVPRRAPTAHSAGPRPVP